MVADEDPGARAVAAARRAAELRKRPDEDPFKPATPRDVEQTDRSVEAARLGAARAARSAAQSFDRSAELHARVAAVEEATIERVAGDTEWQQQSAQFHRRSADEDHGYAEQKRDEAIADEISGDER